jgi:hypothetical protein
MDKNIILFIAVSAFTIVHAKYILEDTSRIFQSLILALCLVSITMITSVLTNN